jgi:hypothetical protein
MRIDTDLSNFLLRRYGAHRLLLPVLVTAALTAGALAMTLLSASVAHAALAAVSPYGEVSHFGGFAEGAVEDKFDEPVGFAVDPENHPSAQEEELTGATKDGNAVYVLDRVASKVPNRRSPEGVLQYRLQKLSSTGVVLASVVLEEQKYAYNEEQEEVEWPIVHPLISLAVDSAKHRVYALEEQMVSIGNELFVPVVGRLVAWSTEPTFSGGPGTAGTLHAASPEYATGDSRTKASVAANLESLNESEDLDAPEALTVDPATHEVVIEAQHGVSGAEGGPTILQRINAEPGHGTLGESWIPSNNSTIASSNELGTGLFLTSTGYGIDLLQGLEKIGRLAQVEASFTNGSTGSLFARDDSGNVDVDQAVAVGAQQTIAEDGNDSNQGALAVYAAGSPVTRLTGSNLYASVFGHAPNNGGSIPFDEQANVGPWNAEVEPHVFWRQGISSENFLANMGVRLFEVSGEGAVEETHIVTTIGGQPTGQECNLDSAQLSLAAGAGGSLFVLTQPNEHLPSNDEVIEFAPGEFTPTSKGACPIPSGEVKITAKNGSPLTKVKNKSGEEELLVFKGSPVKFDASVIGEFKGDAIELKGETPFEFDWNPTGPAGGEELISKIEVGKSDAYLWPAPIVEEYTYNTLGPQEGSLHLIGDYGTSVFPFKIRVVESKPPVAELSGPTTVGVEQPAEFNASASTPTPGSAIAEYKWQFGDGTEAVTESPLESHPFAAASTYHVKLTVIDEVGKEASTETEVQVVAAGPSQCTSNCGGGGQGGGIQTTATTTTTTTSKPPPSPPPPHSTLTKQEALLRALRACHKEKKAKRASCERQAEKKYGPAKSKKTKKKKR